MKIQIVGKTHRNGVGKSSGKPYDFTEVHYLRQSKNVEGLAAVSKTIGAEIMPAEKIIVNNWYNLDFDEDGRIVGMSGVESKDKT